MRWLRVVAASFWVTLVMAYIMGYRIVLTRGTSMLPTIAPYSTALIQPLDAAKSIKVGDLVAVRKVFVSDTQVRVEGWIKRLGVVKPNGACYVYGDNRAVSWDTWVYWRDIEGRVYVLANGWLQTLMLFVVLVEIACWTIGDSVLGRIILWLIKVRRRCRGKHP
jgi:signal peptidase I